MEMNLGDSNLPGARLRYFVTGDRRSGYCVEIEEGSGNCAKAFVSESLLCAVQLGRRLKRGSVFPENLMEIMEDFRCDLDEPVRPAAILKLRRLQQTAARRQLGV